MRHLVSRLHCTSPRKIQPRSKWYELPDEGPCYPVGLFKMKESVQNHTSILTQICISSSYFFAVTTGLVSRNEIFQCFSYVWKARVQRIPWRWPPDPQSAGSIPFPSPFCALSGFFASFATVLPQEKRKIIRNMIFISNENPQSRSNTGNISINHCPWSASQWVEVLFCLFHS